MKRRLFIAAGALVACLAVAGTALSTTRGPNGSIVYAQEVAGHYQLFTIRPDGSGKEQITRSVDWFNPDWSPDGRSIVAERDTASKAGVFTIDANGTVLRNLTPRGLQAAVHRLGNSPMRKRALAGPCDRSDVVEKERT